MEANELTLLVEQAKEHNNHAVEELYNQYHNSVYFLCLKIIKNEDDALDLVQDTFLQAFNKLSTLQNPAQFGSWLNQIAANKCRDFLKKKKPLLFSDKTDENEDSEEFVIENKDESLIPDKVVDSAETRRLVMEIIDNLPDLQRMTVMLYYYEEKSVAQIAEIMECSENTVKSRLSYARKQIKEQILALEKDGTKLYAVMPMLLPLIHNAAADIAMPSTASSALLQHITSSMDASTAGTVHSSTAAGKTVARAKNTAKFSKITSSIGKVVKLSQISIPAKIAICAVVATLVVGTAVHASYQSMPVQAASSINTSSIPSSSVDKPVVSSTSPDSISTTGYYTTYGCKNQSQYNYVKQRASAASYSQSDFQQAKKIWSQHHSVPYSDSLNEAILLIDSVGSSNGESENAYDVFSSNNGNFVGRARATTAILHAHGYNAKIIYGQNSNGADSAWVTFMSEGNWYTYTDVLTIGFLPNGYKVERISYQ